MDALEFETEISKVDREKVMEARGVLPDPVENPLAVWGLFILYGMILTRVKFNYIAIRDVL